MKVSLVSITESKIKGEEGQALTPEELIVYCARVSNPNNQLNTETAPKLLAYLIRNKHWSPLEMVDVCVEIVTSRAIAAQILRHRSFQFQEFSLRYAESACEFEPQEARFKGTSNRQGSKAAETEEEQRSAMVFESELRRIQNHASDIYRKALERGVAPEVARMALPLGLQTRLYMKGTVRSWVHYIEVRCAPSAQKEHRDVAIEIRALLTPHFPNMARALEWPWAI